MYRLSATSKKAAAHDMVLKVYPPLTLGFALVLISSEEWWPEVCAYCKQKEKKSWLELAMMHFY